MAGYYEKIGNLLTLASVDCDEHYCNTCPHLELCRRIADIESSADRMNVMYKNLSDADTHDIRDFASAIARLVSYIDEQKGADA